MTGRKLLLGILAGLPALAYAQGWGWDDGTTPFVVSPPEVVERMLRLAEPKPGEYLIDLGSGDGRIVIEAARRYGTRGLGVDLEPRLVKVAEEDARKAGGASLATVAVLELFDVDISSADILSGH